MKAKVSLLTILLLTAFNLLSQVQWQIIESPVSDNLSSVWINETGHFTIVSEQGTIISTTDGGATWQTNSYPGYNFESVCFPDMNHGVIAGNGNNAFVLSTANGGETWVSTSFVDTTLKRAMAVFFVDSLNGIVVGSVEDPEGLGGYNQCLHTSNGGQNWAKSSLPHISESVFYGAHFRDGLNCNMVGSDGSFYISNDGGANWAMDISFPLTDLNAIYNFGDQTGVVVGNSGTALYTINKWYQYIDLTTNVIVNLNSVWGAPGTNKLWAVGDSGKVIFMDYYLFGWVEQNSGTTENLKDVFILSEDYGVAVGDNGTILVMSSPSSVSEIDNKNEISIFPNPCSNKTTIRFGVTSRKTIELKVFNTFGREVSLLYRGEKQPGSHQIVFDASELPEGIYFVRLNTGKSSITKKMIVRH